MSGNITIPASFAGTIARLIRGAGEAVTLRRQAGGADVPLRAAVQAPGEQPLVGDAQQEGFTVYISALDLVDTPLQFDRLMIRGSERTVEEAHAIVATDRTIAWQCRMIG